MNALKHNKILLVILGAFIIRFIGFLCARPWDLHVQNESVVAFDAIEYQMLALCILEDASFCGNTYRTPGYPFFMAVVYSIVGIKPWAVLLVQVVVDVLTIYIVYKLGELIASRRAGLIGAALIAIDPIQVSSVLGLGSDTLFVPLLLASFYFYINGLKLNRLRHLFYAGVLLAVATLVRPAAQYCLFIMAIIALFWPARTSRIRISYGATFVLCFALTISPWLYRNYVLYDAVKVTSIQGLNLLFWQVTDVRAWETGQPITVVREQFLTEAKALGYTGAPGWSDTENDPFVNEAIAQKVALSYIREHPFVYAQRLLLGVVRTFVHLNTSAVSKALGLSTTGVSVFVHDGEGNFISRFFRLKSTPEIVIGMIGLPLLLINYLSFALGINILTKRREFAILALFVVTIAYFAVSAGVIGYARFRLPIAPFVILVGAVYLDSLLSRRQSNLPVLAR